MSIIGVALLVPYLLFGWWWGSRQAMRSAFERWPDMFGWDDVVESIVFFGLLICSWSWPALMVAAAIRTHSRRAGWTPQGFARAFAGETPEQKAARLRARIAELEEELGLAEEEAA